MNKSPPRRPSLFTTETAVAAFLLTLLALFSIADWSTLGQYDGVDFCQFWGIAKAQQSSAQGLGSPYLHADRYLHAIDALQAQSGDRALATAIHFRKQPDLTGSPLLYAAFAPMPAGYATSLGLFRCLEGFAFLLATGLLLRLAGIGTHVTGAWLATALLAAYDPLMFDLNVGNVNALQLLALTLALLLTLQLRGRGGAAETVAALTLAALLTALMLLKPNLGGAVLALGLCALLRATAGERLLALAAVTVTTSAAIVITAELFGSWTVWLDWWQLTFGSVGRLSYPIDTGNQSTTLYLASHLGVATGRVMLAMAILWATALAAALLWPLRHQDRLLQRCGHRLLELLHDPACGLAIGIVTMYVLSPLLWPHYYVLGLLPVFWLLRGERAWSSPAMLAWCALLLMAGLARRVYTISGGFSDELMFATRVFAWAPLVPALLMKLATRIQAPPVRDSGRT